MRVLRDLIGARYGRWTVVQRLSAGRRPYWLCRCECGTERPVQGGTLTSGASQSCGCLTRERTSERFKKHGCKTKELRSGTKEYRAWGDAKARCHSPGHAWFQTYGARGITMCERWRTDFEAFLADMGPAPLGHSLDRIDPAGNYEPKNCRWADPYTQATNTRRPPTFITLQSGERISAKQFALRSRIDLKPLLRRLRLGETPEDALEHIKQQRPRRWQ